jgi:hypothetical protein
MNKLRDVYPNWDYNLCQIEPIYKGKLNQLATCICTAKQYAKTSAPQFNHFWTLVTGRPGPACGEKKKLKRLDEGTRSQEQGSTFGPLT